MDYASRYIQVRQQVTFSYDVTVADNFLYKCDMDHYGVFIQFYHTDNGVFTSKGFIDALIEKDQHIRFSGSGAAHQKGVAERGIQTVIQMACTMLIQYDMCSPQGTITA